MLNVVIFGAPGSGKGTQSELIIKEYALDHISTGDVLRSEMKNETELGKIAKDYIEKGQLVPDELIVNMLAKVLDSKANSKGVIFDGFPRTIPQAEALKKMLNERGTDVSIMLNLQVDEDELIKRLLERRQSGNNQISSGSLSQTDSSVGRLLRKRRQACSYQRYGYYRRNLRPYQRSYQRSKISSIHLVEA